MKGLTGIEGMQVVSVDGSPRGRKEYMLWCAPRVRSITRHIGEEKEEEEEDGKERGSSLEECSRLLYLLLMCEIRTIAFCRVCFG